MKMENKTRESMLEQYQVEKQERVEDFKRITEFKCICGEEFAIDEHNKEGLTSCICGRDIEESMFNIATVKSITNLGLDELYESIADKIEEAYNDKD